MALLEDRSGCALQGATRLLGAIDGVVPVLHASAGCGASARFAAEALSAGGGLRPAGPGEISSTTLQEKQVVFGGTSRLREQLKNAVKVQQGDLYVVVTGCVPEVVGDDTPAMVKEAREQRFPVISVVAPGFKGNGWTGYAAAARLLLEELAGVLDARAAAPASSGPSVNVFGIVPGQDPGWEGDLLEIEALLAEVGLRANRLVGLDQTIASWRQAGLASASLVLSPWGREAATFLRDRHGIPIADLGWLPVGSRDALLLLERLAAVLPLERSALDAVGRRLDGRLRYFLRKAAPHFLLHDVQLRVAIVGPSAAAVGYARFLAGTLGQHVEQVVITDQPPDAACEALRAALAGGVGPAVAVSFDAAEPDIDERLRRARPQLILGSADEAGIARALGAAHLEIALPLEQRPVLSRSHAGVAGAVTLVEDLFAAINRHRVARDRSEPPPQAIPAQPFLA